jgi:hypothetical protein
MGGPPLRGGLGIATPLVAVLWGLGMLAVALSLVVAHRRRATSAVRR